LALLLGATVWQLCRKHPQPERGAAIIISGDTRGWITPCGCTANQSGGLLRRATYLTQLRGGSDVLYFDVGGAGAGNSPFELAKFQATLTGERMMGISAHNIGASELAIGVEALQRAAELTHVPLISANAHITGGPLIAPPLRVFDIAGKHLAVIGVLSPRYAVTGITIDDPRQAITDAIAAHKKEFDSVLVLAYLSDDELRDLVSALPEADAIVGGPTGQSIVPRKLGPVVLASATNKGKFLVRLDLPTASSSEWKGDVVELGPTYTDDPAQTANLNAYLEQLRERDFSAVESGFAPALPAGAPTDYLVAGSASCVKCHSDSVAVWSHSLHAFAGDALRPRHFESDPDCLRCHTTAYGLPGGFISPARTPKMYGVGCESCHGPSESHVLDPTIHTQYLAMDQCLRCHDEENSPTFDRPIYWQRIRHGKSTTRPTQTEMSP